MNARVLFSMVCLAAALHDAAAAVPPLTASEQLRLETAIDGVDRRDEAFAALVEHVRGWPVIDQAALDSLPLRRRVDGAAMEEQPQAMRGDLVLLDGTLAQRTDLPRPWQGVDEWFVRDDFGETVIALVDGPLDATQPNPGDRVRVLGRLYKPITQTSRDGVDRTWPALVGVRLQAAPEVGTSGGRLVVVLAGVVLLGALAWAVLRRRVQDGGHGDVAEALAAIRPDADEEEVDEGPLPGDPAEALAEMRARQGNGKDADA